MSKLDDVYITLLSALRKQARREDKAVSFRQHDLANDANQEQKRTFKQEVKKLVLAEMQAVYDEQAKKSLYETTLTRHHYIKALKKRIEEL